MKKKTIPSLTPVPSSKTVFALGVAVPFVIFLFAYIMNGVFPFGDKILLDADSFHQYLPFLTEFRRKLVHGESLFYSFSGGLGYDFWASFAYYTSSPMNLLLALVSENSVCDFMVWLTVLKVSICAGILAWYLSNQHKENSLFAIAFGTMYAFSNYLVSYKYNIMWLDSIAVVPLVMYGLEKIVRGEHLSCYLLSLFYAIWCNYYIGYMVCIFSCLYLVFLFVTSENINRETIIRTIVRFISASLVAGGLASVILIPSYLALRESTAMVTGESSGIQFYNNVLSMLRAHYMESDAFRISHNRGEVHLYCGMMVLPLAALFFSDRSIQKKIRLAYAVFLGFLLFSCTFSPLNFAWHGFHNESGLPNRFSFLYDLLLLKLCYSGLPRLKTVSEKSLNRIIICILGSSVLFALWDTVAQNSFRVSLSLGCLALYIVILYELRSNSKKEKKYSLILCVLMILEAGGYGMIDLSLNGTGWERSYYLDYQNDFQSLLTEQNEDGFYRSNVDSDSSNFITFVGGSGVSLFNSTMQDSVSRFLGGMNLHSEKNMVILTGGTKLLYDLLGVRYFVTENIISDTWNGFEKILDLNGRFLYRNGNSLPLGFMVPEEITLWQPEPNNGMGGQNDLARILCGIDELCPLVQEFKGKDGIPMTFEISDGCALFVTLDEDPYELTWETPEYSKTYEKWFRYLLLPAQGTEKSSQAILTVTTSDGADYTGKVYSCRTEDYQQVVQALSHNPLQDVTVFGNQVSGSVLADQDGILLLTIPFNKGWEIKADGKSLSPHIIGGALIGIPLQQGHHQIEMRYTPQGFEVGCVFSFISLLLASYLLFFEEKNHRFLDGGLISFPKKT